MKISFMFVAALALASAGCKKKSAGSAGNDCAKAINHSMSLSKAEMAKTPGMDATMEQKLTALGVKRCTEDKWSAEAVKCMVDAKTMTDSKGCYGKLTKDQQEMMNKAAMEMAMGPHGGGSATVDTGSAGSADGGSAGSGAGSAGSAGSASVPAGSADTGSGSAGSAAAPK